MSRSVPEWIGASDDTPVPQRVRVRVFERFDGRCHACTRKILGETWTCEHLVALINGGENRENNLGVTCRNCLPIKNAADVAEKAKTYRKKSKHIGARQPSRHPLPFGKNSKFKQKIGGTIVPREQET